MGRVTRCSIAVAVAASLGLAWPALAQTIATADLQIAGAGLRLIDTAVSTGIDIPVTIQTEFAGKQNEDAPAVEGLHAVGELIGPGIDAPIRLETVPGFKFQVPGLPREGTYFLQNIRLTNGVRELLQPAVPSVATISVANVFETSVRVRQLTPEELRARGITIDARNETAYEYVFTFLVNGQVIEVPYPVIIDNRTHEVRTPAKENPYSLPPTSTVTPPRWSPPQTIAIDLAEEIPTPQAPEQLDAPAPPRRPSIPAAIVIPNDIAVLNQFFAVALVVTNNAAGGDVRLDSISGLLKPPPALRTVRSEPAVPFGQPVPVLDKATGVSFLVAQAVGEAEWVLEGLKPGTHRIDFEVRATFKSAGQQDVPLRGVAGAAVHVHDPRFNITFSHPDVIQKGFDYSTFSFITNLSGASQTIRVRNGVPSCTTSPGANVCRVEGTPESHELTIPPGEMRMIEYQLRPGLTGRVFATAGTVDGDAITAAVELHMGVSESGIPLSPTTLVLPHYARYLDPQFVSSYLTLLGLGYSLATAPMTPATAVLPRVIRTDVFQRAVDLARAGQRVYLGEPMADAMAHLTLDLLGNSVELREWDELRRRDRIGRTAGAALARQLETVGLPNGIAFGTFLDRFAVNTAHRDPYLLALAHAPASAPALAVRDSSGRRAAVSNEAGGPHVRNLPFADISALRLADGSRVGELGVVGRWSDGLEVLITPEADGLFTLELIYPAANAGSLLRATVEVTGKRGEALRVPLNRGDPTVRLLDAAGGAVGVTTASPVSASPIRLLGARQDLFLDENGHRVSLLFNRPVGVPEGQDLAHKFQAEIALNRDGLDYRGVRAIAGAALQDEKRIVNLSFFQSLHQNATYSIAISSLLDPLTNSEVILGQQVAPVIENNQSAGIVYGRVLQGDGTPIANAEVTLTNGADQVDRSRDPDGTFLFESVPRDPASSLSGVYRLQAITAEGKFTSLTGAIRLPGRVQSVVLMFLGRGRAEGFVRYGDGQPAADARVVIGSIMFGQARQGRSNASGFYRIEDLPVGPLTFSATDADGNVGFAAGEIKSAGELLVKDIRIHRRPFPGFGTVRGHLRRSDTGEPVAGARVGVFAQGFAVAEAASDAEGRFEFTRVPAGFVSLLAAEWSLSRESASLDFDLAPDEVRDVALTLRVNPEDPLVAIQGEVRREDPLFPGDASRYQRVEGALLKIADSVVVTADQEGRYLFESVPASFAGRWLRAFDPVTKRTGSAVLPALSATEPNIVPILIRTQDGFGTGTVRVRLMSAAGFPVSGFRVIEPGVPPVPFTEMGGGVFELKDVAVGRALTVFAVPKDAGGPFGEQAATGTVRVEFTGHIASLVLRLPGQGVVRAKLTGDIDLIGDVELSYLAWNEAQQALALTSRTASTLQNGQAGYATFEKVPAGAFNAASAHPLYGYATLNGRLAFDGDVATITLQLAKLSRIRGRVYAIDGVTPLAGATVRLNDGSQNQGFVHSGADGSFVFHNVPAATRFSVIAEATQNGIFRTGIAAGRTPDAGGPVEIVAVVMRRQGSVEGRIVYSAFKVYDPADSSNNVVDDTPGTLADNAPVPLAHFSLRELAFPERSFGSIGEPLVSDSTGRFVLGNLFEGTFRISAADPGNPGLRGDYTAAIQFEGEKLEPIVGIGDGGVGSATVLVVDPNRDNAPVPDSEVILSRGGTPFDAGSTNSSGVIRFDNLPVGTYVASGYAQRLGRSGRAPEFSVLLNANTDVRLLLEFSGGVDGRVTDPEKSGAAVAGAAVTLSAASFEARATSIADGSFSFEGVREGDFSIEARDAGSPRRAASAGLVSSSQPRPFIPLPLEPTETLIVNVFLPDDAGANSNVLASLVNLEVRQGCRWFEFLKYCDLTRRYQGNSFQIPDLLERSQYEIDVAEVGGAERRVSFVGSFPKGSALDPLALVLPAYGTVEVRVSQGGVPAANATVYVSGGGSDIRAFTDSAGVALLRGIRLGEISVQVTSFDQRFTASTTALLSSQSTPLVVTVSLGSYATITGFVEAETGGASTGTRVSAAAHTRLETMTDSNGRFQFTGIPTTVTGTRVDLTYIGPDEVTPGASQTVIIGNDAAGATVEVPPVRLDATPPTLLSFFPANGATSVSPDATLRFVFSEAIAPQFVSNTFIKLVPADSSTAVNASYVSSTNADGTFTVMLVPPPPTAEQQAAGQRFPLRSNTLYRIVVSDQITDLTGHRLPGMRGGSFITSDYAEPRVLSVTPSPLLPVDASTTFSFRFNEPIDPAPWLPGGLGRMRLYKIDRPGVEGQIQREIPGAILLDASYLSLSFAPNELLAEQSFYRVVFSGVQDPQGNALAEQTYHFFSFDRVAPVAALISPVPGGYPLVSGVEYLLGINLKNPDGSAATDIKQVEYVRIEGTAETFLAAETRPPFAYRFVASELIPSLTLGARARDLSGNISAPVTMSWTVVPDLAPRNVAVALNPAAGAYPGSRVSAVVTFEDEGVLTTVQVNLRATHSDDSAYSASQTKQVTRPTVADPWPGTTLEFTLPPTLKAGTTATFTATVTDVRGQQGSGSAGLGVIRDTGPPQVTIIAPAAGELFLEGTGNTVAIRATATDVEVAVKEVVAQLEGGGSAILTRGTGDEYTGSIPVPSIDDTETVTRTITVTARDYELNSASATVSIRIEPLYDPSAPVVRWSCSSRGVMAPAGSTAKLRVFALGNDEGNTSNGVQTVEFFAGQSTTPIAASAVSGMPNHYEASFTVPADAAAESRISLRAVVKNLAGKTSEASSSILVVTGRVVTSNTTITAGDTSWDNQTVIVQSGTLTVTGAHTFARLLILDGAKVTHPATNTETTQQLALQVTGDVYIACGGAVDVTGRGYIGMAGGFAQTYPNVTSNGSYNWAGGSHGGLGGIFNSAAVPGLTYGSLFDPGTPGAAGARGASETCICNPPGGGVARIRALNIALDGSILANGADGDASGAGGSIRLDVESLTGSGQIRADGGANNWATGGGGHVAVYYQTLTLDPANMTAAGGVTGGPKEFVGAPGTVFLKSATQSHGDLIVANRGRITSSRTRVVGVGIRTVDVVGADFVRGTGAQFPSPNLLRGIRLVVNNGRTVTWPILANDAEQIQVDVTAAPLTAQAGQPFRGLFKLDTLKVRNANLEFEDLLEVGSAIDKDASSTVIGGNEFSPVLDSTRVSLVNSALGPSVLGSPGAVSDIDVPISLIATNGRTGSTFTATAGGDGSFAFGVHGQQDDLISIRARDSHRFPLESPSFDVGRMPASSDPPTQIGKSGWGVDSNFLARTVALEGRHLVVASRKSDGVGASGYLSVFDVSTPGSPVLRQSLTISQEVRDVAIHNGYAYIGADRVWVIPLNVSTLSAAFGPAISGSCPAVATDGSYLFAGDESTNGRISIFDIASNPASLRWVRDQFGLTNGYDVTDLLLLGPEHLVAISPRSGGKDVTVISRRDINNLQVVATLDIPNFLGFRGVLVGNTLHLAGSDGFAIVDLSNPTAPSVVSVTALPSAARGMSAAGGDGLLALPSNGVRNFGLQNLAAPVLRGAILVNGAAWDVAINGQYAYIANESGLTVARVDVAPRITHTLITGVKDGTLYRVQGAAGSVTGQPALQAELRNDTQVSAIETVVNSDGSFQASIPAQPGDRISVKATDGVGRVAGPVVVGSVPFGTSTTLMSVAPDSNFRARTLAWEGNNLVVASRNWDGVGSSGYVSVFDVSTPNSPLLRGHVSTAQEVRDVVIHNGHAYIGADWVITLPLNGPSLSPVYVRSVPGFAPAVAVDGTYLFAGDESINGRISVFDITNPAVPQWLRDQYGLTNGYGVTDLLVLGSEYLVAISPRSGGKDVTVISRRDINNLQVVGTLDIPNFLGFRGVIQGQHLYISGFEEGVAVVDLSNPASPLLRSLTNTPGITRGLDLTGATLAAADAGYGAAFLDISTSENVRLRGSQAVPGNVWDVRFGSSVLYAANEFGLAVVHQVDIAPKIAPALIRVGNDGAGNAPVVGAPASITGQAPLVVELRNKRTDAAVPGVAVASDGSFQSSILGMPGDRISVKATDGVGRVAGPVVVGSVPFGTSTTLMSVAPDSNFRARTLAWEGNNLVVASRNWDGVGSSGYVSVFDVSTPNSPLLRGHVSTAQEVRDVVIHNGHAYIGADWVITLPLNGPSLSPVYVRSVPGFAPAVAVGGTYLFAGDESINGRISVFDITNPAVPQWLRDQYGLTNGYGVTDLLVLGNEYLVAISPRSGGKDVTVISRRDINNLQVVATLDIPNFLGFRGVIEGHHLYVSGFEEGVAVVDLSNPASPLLKSLTNTPGITRGLDVTGSFVAAADNNQGVTFLDAAIPDLVRTAGTQTVAGTIWDARFGDNVLYLAREQGIAVIDSVEAPPLIHAWLIRTTTDGASTATVTGAARSITGQASFGLTVENSDTGVSTPNVAVATDGSFSATVAGGSAQRLRVKVTDRKGKRTERAVTPVPFANDTYTHQAGPAQAGNDTNFRARRLEVSGELVRLSTRKFVFNQTSELLSNQQLLFTLPNASGTPTVQSVAAGTSPGIYDFTASSDWSFIASARFSTVNGTTVYNATDFNGDETAVAVIGNFAFTATTAGGDGRIRIYDITTKTAPVFRREQSMLAGVTFRRLIAMGSNHLLALTPDLSAGTGYDLIVIDCSNVDSLSRIGQLVIPDFEAFDGALDGTTLYLVSGEAGIAIVELSALTSPVLESVINTPGIARGVAVSGANEIVVADSHGSGVTFVDVTDRRRPLIKGSQRVAGSAVDVRVSGRTVYVATEQHLFIMMRP